MNYSGVNLNLEEGDILEEQVIARLMELDARAFEISAGREKQLADIERRYKEEEQKMIKDFTRRIEDETREIAQKILQEGQQEVEKLNLKTGEILENMEREFEKSRKDMTDEILKRIFDVKRENHG
ncbi:MAG TPA: hypothetical protein GXX35_12675 [Thermoanaerobacterales bacterium]|nr:hypothetical protein [Thermoanaerobacterales bacterium]